MTVKQSASPVKNLSLLQTYTTRGTKITCLQRCGCESLIHKEFQILWPAMKVFFSICNKLLSQTNLNHFCTKKLLRANHNKKFIHKFLHLIRYSNSSWFCASEYLHHIKNFNFFYFQNFLHTCYRPSLFFYRPRKFFF